MNRRGLIIGSSLVLASAAIGQSRDYADTALVLSTDVSGSVNQEEYQLQKIGIAKAFTSPMMEKKLRSTSVAVVYHEWNSKSSFGDWFLVHSINDAQRFAQHVMDFERISLGGTGVADAIIQASAVVTSCPYEVGRRVIDISGDGVENLTGNVLEAKLSAKASNIQINGLPILNSDDPDEPDLIEWYQNNVIVGPGSFLMPADGFQDFENAMLRKLVGELG